MAGKSKTMYLCDECGYENTNWFGKCPNCGKWNTMREFRVSQEPAKKNGSEARREQRSVKFAQIERVHEARQSSGIRELDRVLGGGIVRGSMILIGGDPGIGKSTLLLQTSGYLCENGRKVLYVSGEESLSQIAIRAQRIGVDETQLDLLAETSVETILDVIGQEQPEVVVIDSIQTMLCEEAGGVAGSISQVRESTAKLLRYAKNQNVAIFLVGHVTKEGAIAGPRILEHMVDTVLYFEGDSRYDHRILRAVKNRFGSTNEIGIFEMTDRGMIPVEDPSGILLFKREEPVNGCAVVCTLEGTRPINVEVQALTSSTVYGNPRRMSAGFDHNRMALLLAVMEKIGGMPLGGQDAYVNVAGGLRLDDPGADLAVCAAVASAFLGRPIPDKTAFIGEVGLTGEVRGAQLLQQRIAECASLGFETIYVSDVGTLQQPEKLKIVRVHDITSLLRGLFGKRKPEAEQNGETLPF